jgi:hypothetical protein
MAAIVTSTICSACLAKRTQKRRTLKKQSSASDSTLSREEAQKESVARNMVDKEVKIDFAAPATLRKWPSVKNERVSASLGARPYLIMEGTLDECIRKFMSQPTSQHHLYEIHTAPQSDLVTAILSAEHVVELARLRDFL